MANKVHILVVDDEPDTLLLFAQFFSAKGWLVDVAETPNQMIESVNRKLASAFAHYDAIICDINFFGQGETPRITGVAAIEDLRQADCHMPVIFVSGYVNQIIREQIKNVGGLVLSKPVDLDELFNLTLNSIEKTRANFDREPCGTETHITNSAILQTIIEEVREKEKEKYV
jgi:CheY-like chemotaxis protein